jgi:hypothetical protein
MYFRCAAAFVLTLGASSALADFTYEETTRITGGAMVGVIRMAGAFSKDAAKAMDPIQSTISVKGNRLLRKSNLSTVIMDIDAETITTINPEKKTYSVMTFAQMKEMMQQMSEKMKQGKGKEEVDWDVKMDDTGQTKSINGSQAHEMIMTITMKGTDAKSGAQGAMNVKSDMWIASKINGYDEMRDFHKRLAQKMDFMAGGNPFLNRPDIARAMGAMMKEGSKLDGMPLQTMMKMQGDMTNMPAGEQQQQQQSARSQAPPPTSLSGALGGALAGRLGRRNKSQDDASAGNATPGDPNTLIETTTEVTSYSSAPVDTASWEVPAGFKKVEPDTKMRGR